MIGRPEPAEAAAYYFTYIDKVTGDDATSGLSQSNDYYERIVISMCRSLPNQSSYPSNSVLT